MITSSPKVFTKENAEQFVKECPFKAKAFYCATCKGYHENDTRKIFYFSM